MERSRCFRKRTYTKLLEDKFLTMGLTVVGRLPPGMAISRDTPVPSDYLIILPDITKDSDADLIHHMTNMSIYERAPKILPKDSFLLPSDYVNVLIRYESGEVEFELPVFEPSELHEPSEAESIGYFTELFSNVLSKGDVSQVYQLLMEIDTEAFVQCPSLKLILVPGRREFSLPPGVEHLFQIMRLRSKFHLQPIPLNLIEKVLTDMIDSWELPQEKEVIDYSLDRIPKTDSVCQPVEQKALEFTETTAGKAKQYVRISDVPDTFDDSGMLVRDVFSVFVVYLEPEGEQWLLKIAIARVNFAEIGSKHAHVAIHMLPRRFRYVFSGEMILEDGAFSYNLNSGMFYHLHKAPGMKRNFTQDVSSVDMSTNSEEYSYVRGFLFSNTLHWEEFSKVVMESLLETPVVLKGNIRRPKMKLSGDQLSAYCSRENFSFRVFPTKKACEAEISGKDLCQ
jgi:hypothetical protein